MCTKPGFSRDGVTLGVTFKDTGVTILDANILIYCFELHVDGLSCTVALLVDSFMPMRVAFRVPLFDAIIFGNRCITVDGLICTVALLLESGFSVGVTLVAAEVTRFDVVIFEQCSGNVDGVKCTGMSLLVSVSREGVTWGSRRTGHISSVIPGPPSRVSVTLKPCSRS